MTKYLVFMDLDGTLLVDHKHITDRTKATIKKLQAKGVVFYIATGRMYELAKITQRMLPDVKMVTSNGAVFDGVNGREITKLGGKTVETAYKITQEDKMPMMLFTPEKAYFTEKIPDFIAQNAGNFDESFGFEEVDSFERLQEIEDDITNGVVLSRGDKDELETARQKLAATKLLLLSSSGPDNIEMIPLNTDKGTAVQKIQQEHKVDADHTFVFGDGFNDVGMMKAAGLSVAMGNAQPGVKDVANYLTDTNENDGLAKFLEQYFEKHPLD